MSYAEAIAQATGPGQMFELVPYTVNGVTYKVFKNAPQSLRDFYAFGRMHGDKPFVVYEDQRRSYAETMAEADAFAAALVDHFGIKKGDRVADRDAQLPRVGHLLRSPSRRSAPSPSR